MEPENKNVFKANWDAVAAQAFCEICAQEKLDGNRPTAFLSHTGYQNLEKKFYERTKRVYTRKQFKNRWDAVKSLYLAWKYYRSRATGLGWNSDKMTFTADEGWWKEIIEGNKLCAGFRDGPPPYLKELETMFEKAHVDGRSSFMPGAATNEKETIFEEDDQVEEVLVTPQSVVRGAGKRPLEMGENTPKLKKSAIQKDFKRMVDHYTSGANAAASNALDLTSEIEAIMVKVVECGADEASEEYYIATKLFGKLENRVFFNNMKTHEGRKMWLTRMYQDRKN
ncbi:unnamed protein product [Alopecurus aequalis]